MRGRTRKANERVIHSRWDVTEKRWLQRNKMPNGVRLALERRDGRRVRGDAILHRRRLPIAASEDDTVKSALDALRESLITDIVARGQLIRLYAPGRVKISENSKMRTVRAIEPLPTTEQVREQQLEEDEVDLAADEAGNHLIVLDESCGSEEISSRAFVKALLQRHGFDAVKTWVIAENQRLYHR